MDARRKTALRRSSLHVELRGAYGSPRMVRELRGRGFPASKVQVERLMQENDIRAKHKRRFKLMTDSTPGYKSPAQFMRDWLNVPSPGNW